MYPNRWIGRDERYSNFIMVIIPSRLNMNLSAIHRQTGMLILLLLHSYLLKAQSFETLHPKPVIPCQGMVQYNNPINPDTTLPILSSRDTGVVVPWLNLNKGWNVLSDTSLSGEYYLASAAWFSGNTQVDNWIIFPLTNIPSKACMSFQAWSFDDEYLEDLEIWISEFSLTSDSIHLGQKLNSLTVPHDKTWISSDLSAWAGLNRWIGIRHTSLNKFILGIDQLLMTDVSQSGLQIPIAGWNRKPTLGDSMDLKLWIRNESVDSAQQATLVLVREKNGVMEDSLSSDISFPSLQLNESTLFTLEDQWIPAAFGNYTFKIYLKSGSHVSDTMIVSESVEYALSLEDRDVLHDLNLWPNPAQFSFQFTCQEDWQIYNAKGERVLQGNGSDQSIHLDCQTWAAGIYFLKTMETGSGIRFLIERDSK